MKRVGLGLVALLALTTTNGCGSDSQPYAGPEDGTGGSGNGSDATATGGGGSGATGGGPGHADAASTDVSVEASQEAASDGAAEGASQGPDAGGCTDNDTAGCIDEVAAKEKSDFGNEWKDSWFIMGCPQKDGHDCRTVTNCPNQNATNFEDRGAVANETFPLGGITGKNYAVSFTFNGLAEGKYYSGGQYALPDTDVAMPGGSPPSVDEAGVNKASFYIGGSAVASDYNVMRIRVLDHDKNETARFYMNAFPSNSGAESHRTFLYSYQHTITVPGGGFVEYHISDSNCKAVDNCGAGTVSDTGECNNARKIPNEPNAVLPAMYTDVASPTQPHPVSLASLNPVTGATQPWHAQIGHLTVTKVVPK